MNGGWARIVAAAWLVAASGLPAHGQDPGSRIPGTARGTSTAASIPVSTVKASPTTEANEDATDVEQPIHFDAKARRKLARLSPLGEVPPSPTNRYADDPRARRLGHFLFFDPRLSANGAIACATCHVPERGFSDGKSLAEGLARGTRHTPTLWNVAYQRWFFWDGRADSLWAQALGPIENPIEMGFDRLALAHLIAGDADLRRAYEDLFGELPPLADGARFPDHGRPVPEAPDHPHEQAWAGMRPEDRTAVDRVFANVGKALEAYERQLVRREAPFDRFVRELLATSNDPASPKRPEDALPTGTTGMTGATGQALSPAAQRGLQIFLGEGRCTLCHVGPAFTDLEFHNTSAPTLDGGEDRDPGRYRGARKVVQDPFNAAGAFSDDPEGPAARRVRTLRQTSESWGEFKTPGLRNLVERAPYMHQGQFATLRDVVHFYSTLEGSAGRSHHQEQILVPLRLSSVDEAALVAFLESLSGAPPDPHWLKAPPSPLPGSPR